MLFEVTVTPKTNWAIYPTLLYTLTMGSTEHGQLYGLSDDTNSISNSNTSSDYETGDSSLSRDRNSNNKCNSSSSSSQSNDTSFNKCSLCNRMRERNDLCNRCRQKVESRVRMRMEEKIMGDIQVVAKISQYMQNMVNLELLNAKQYHQLWCKLFPFLVCNLICILYFVTD